MIKDRFEIEIGKRLRETKAAVPAGSWAAIQSRLKASTGNVPPKQSVPFSNAGFVVGLIAGAAMIISLTVHTAQDAKVNEKSFVELSETPASQEKPPVVVVQNKQDVDVTSTKTESTVIEQMNNAPDVVVIEKIKHDEIRNETNTIQNKISAKPIAKYDAREINAKHRTPSERRKLAANTHTEASKNIKSPSNISAKISADKTSGYAPLTVHFDNNFKGQSYYWEFGFRAESTDKSPSVIFEEPGNYTIYLTVENSSGEIYEDFIEINVLEGSSVFFPNAFTPNGDGHNDTYKVASNENIEEFYMIITDQNGKTIFESRDINREWVFDHSMPGAAEARYFLTYKAVGSDGKEYTGYRKPIYVLF